MAITVPIPRFDGSHYFLTGKLVDVSSTASLLLLPVPAEGRLVGVLYVLSGDISVTNLIVRFGVNGTVIAHTTTIAQSGSLEGDCFQTFNTVPISLANGYVKVGDYVKVGVFQAATGAEDLGVTFVFKRA